MLVYIIPFICILWYFFHTWKLQDVIEATKQFQNDFPAVPLIGHALMFLGTNEDRMTTIKNLASKAIENGSNFTYFWLGFDLYVETILGIKCSDNRQRIKLFSHAFEEYFHIISKRLFAPWLYPDSIYKVTSDYAKLKQQKKIIIGTFKEAVLGKRQELSKRNQETKNTDEKRFSILEYLLEMHHGLSDKELLEETLVLAMAGIETTAITAAFTTLILSMHPDVQKKLYKEVKETLGDPCKPVDYNSLEKLSYLEAVIFETLRLYPSVPIVARNVDKNITLPSGLRFVKGSNVIFNIWGIHRNPKYWGENADAFIPDRFQDKNNLYPNAFIPFSIGPRNCIGYRYALLSLKTVFASLILRYRIEPSSATNCCQPLRLEFNLTLKHLDNYQVKFTRR